MSSPVGWSRIGITGIALGSGAIGLGYAAGFVPAARALAPWFMAGGIALLLPATIWLGAHRSGTRAPALVLAATGILAIALAGGFAAALLLPPETAGSALWLGLPRRAALLLYGIGVFPAMVLPAVYAITFDRHGLDDARLEEIRNRLKRLPGEKEGEEARAPRSTPAT